MTTHKKEPDEVGECPICKGSGLFFFPKHRDKEILAIKTELAKTLHGKGFSLRQIQKALGYGSVRSVHLLINKK